jgi:hypothetical protein
MIPRDAIPLYVDARPRRHRPIKFLVVLAGIALAMWLMRDV